MGRYERNIGTITVEENELIKHKSVCIVGCGGIGGGVIENLVRIGVGKLTVVDADVFEDSNLNRQVLSNEQNLGKEKTSEAAEQMGIISSEVSINPVQTRVDASNAESIIKGHDVVVDALDNVDTRKILEHACEKAGIPLVHGAIGGWNGQVGVILPGGRIIERVYADYETSGQEIKTGNPSFTPAIIAGIEAAEVIKLLIGSKSELLNKLLMIDLLTHEYEIIDFN